MAVGTQMTPDQRFNACATFTLHQEDQTDSGVFENDPRDSGGATRWGVTQAALSDWFGRPATVDEVRTLPRDTALLIARHKYWTPARCNDLPAGVDLMVFDMAYNAGVGRSAKLLQTALGVTADGQIGPATLGAVVARTPSALVHDLSAAQTAYYRSLKNPTYERGWLNRVAARTAAAMKMVA